MNRKQQREQRARWICTTRRTSAAVAVAACFSSVVLANPVNPTVVHGTASFSTAGNILNITNSPNAIINWGSFSIGVNELTRFIQQSGSSAVLNRVIGQDPSAILGALQSNGRVFLINPNGIVFGAGAQINVAGLVASTLNLSNDDFLNNRMKFTDGAGAGSVVNQSSISGGSVYLIGSAVTNNGLITSPNGEVILAAGNSVELVNPGTPNLRVEITAPDNEAKNLGTITADAGRIGIYAGLINNSGTLRADSAVAEGGRIVLRASKNVHLAAASQTSASGTSGGRVDIQAGDTAIVEGDIAATGSAGAGGTVQVLGNLVGLTGHANIDASGTSQGGTVLVGGDFQGKNPDVENAFRTYVGADVTIHADAITAGDGGKVIVWADDTTRAYGNFSARGGANAGNGGFVETSGKQYLDVAGINVNTSAPHGAVGVWLLDPTDITIVHGTASSGASFGPSPPGLFNSGGGATAMLNDFDINSNLATTDVTITTTSAANNPGNITFDASAGAGGSIVITNGTGASRKLILNADNDIIFSGGSTTFQTTAAGALGVDFNPGAGRKVDVLSGASAAFNGFSGSVGAFISGASGKTWENAGTVTLSGVSYIDLNHPITGDTSTFNNNASGVLNLNSTQGWAIQSTSGFQAEPINNAGTINVNTGTSFEALYNQSSTGVLNISGGQTLSMQNGQNIAGTVNIGAGGALRVSEWHGSDTFFNGTNIGGSGTLQVFGSGPKAKFTNVSAPGVILRLGGGGQIQVLNGTSTFAALNLDSPSYGGAFSISNGVFAQSAGNLIVPTGSSYTGNAKYWAQGGDAIISGVVDAAYGGASMEIEAAGNIKILGGGDVSGVAVKLKGVNIEVGDSTSTSAAEVYASSLLDILASGALKIKGGSGANASALVSSSGTLTVSASGDVILAGGAGSNAWARLSGNPDVVLSKVGGAIYMDAGSGAGSYAVIESVSPTTIYATFPNLASGGYFVNGVEGTVYDAATSTGFTAGGSPAVLGSSLKVTYGGGAAAFGGDTLETPTQTLIVALGESTEPPEAEKDKDVFKETEGDKKKDAPVCR